MFNLVASVTFYKPSALCIFWTRLNCWRWRIKWLAIVAVVPLGVFKRILHVRRPSFSDRHSKNLQVALLPHWTHRLVHNSAVTRLTETITHVEHWREEHNEAKVAIDTSKYELLSSASKTTSTDHNKNERTATQLWTSVACTCSKKKLAVSCAT